MDSNKQLPEGTVQTVDGKVIDRADAAFALRTHPKNPSIVGDVYGTVYQKDENGTLRRLTPKKSLLRKKTLRASTSLSMPQGDK